MAKIIPNIQFPISPPTGDHPQGDNKNPNVQCQKFILELGIRHFIGYWKLGIGKWILSPYGESPEQKDYTPISLNLFILSSIGGWVMNNL